MHIASAKRKENIAEYLLYMWQVEDMIRALGLDIDRIDQALIQPTNLTDDEKKDVRQWYESLIDMMRRENITEAGHLQMNRNTLGALVDLHRQLLADPKEQDYQALFNKVLPYIVELRSRAGSNPPGELEALFTALYGTLLMRLKGQQPGADTQAAMGDIAKLVATLAARFHKEENNPTPTD